MGGEAKLKYDALATENAILRAGVECARVLLDLARTGVLPAPEEELEPLRLAVELVDAKGSESRTRLLLDPRTQATRFLQEFVELARARRARAVALLLVPAATEQGQINIQYQGATDAVRFIETLLEAQRALMSYMATAQPAAAPAPSKPKIILPL